MNKPGTMIKTGATVIEPVRRLTRRNLVIALAAIVLVLAAFGSFFQIDQGERGIVLRNGKLIRVADPGLDFKVPIIDRVNRLSVRDHTVQLKTEAYSFDQQPAMLLLSVTYRVPANKVANVYSEYGSLANIQNVLLERRTLDSSKKVFGKFTAARAIQERNALGMEMLAHLQESLETFPLSVVSIQLEDISFSDAYVKSIEQRMLAQVQIETTRQQKETATINAEIQVVKARAEADARREQYTAEADGIRLRGEAEAMAIRARAQALAINPAIVQLNAVDKWNGVLPTTMVPGASVPFIGVK